MTGVWEQRLQHIAHGQEFAVPSAAQLMQSMHDLSPVLFKAADDPGITGKAGMTAAESMYKTGLNSEAVASTTQKLIAAVKAAGAVQDAARKALDGLEPSPLNAGD
jgi:hypothetical protein